MRGIFVTGTDTGVGKTTVAAGLLRWIRTKGIDTVPMKPVQTGCEPAMTGETGGDPESSLRVPDLELMLAAADLAAGPDEMALMCPFRYQPACSPHLAGRMEGHFPSIDAIEESARRLLVHHEALVVEGAGGVLVPLDEQSTMRDLMRRLALPVVIVARPDLGTINHTLLTIEALRSAGLRIVGVVYNDLSEGGAREDDWIRDDNPGIITRLSGVPSLGRLGRLGSAGNAGPLATPHGWHDIEEALEGRDAILKAITGD